jgi:hypothetical protein
MKMNETSEQCKARWAKAFQPLVGRRIAAVRWLGDDEVEELGWTEAPIALQLDDGTLLWPSQDDEGNGAGALFVQGEKLPEVAPVIWGARP